MMNRPLLLRVVASTLVFLHEFTWRMALLGILAKLLVVETQVVDWSRQYGSLGRHSTDACTSGSKKLVHLLDQLYHVQVLLVMGMDVKQQLAQEELFQQICADILIRLEQPHVSAQVHCLINTQ